MRTRRCKHDEYFGVDLNVESKQFYNYETIRANYREKAALDEILKFSWRITAWTSLFSTEITAPYPANYELYKYIFENSKIKVGVVSGFYYANRKTEAVVGEAGGILSYQTLESLEDVKNDVFDEIRSVVHVPSKMFGEDVYEVWKLFIRK